MKHNTGKSDSLKSSRKIAKSENFVFDPIVSYFLMMAGDGFWV